MLVLDMRARLLEHIRHYYSIYFIVERGANISGLISSVHRFQIGERSFRLDCHCCSSMPPPTRIICRYIIIILLWSSSPSIDVGCANQEVITVKIKLLKKNLNGISQKIKNIKLTKTHRQNVGKYTPLQLPAEDGSDVWMRSSSHILLYIV